MSQEIYLIDEENELKSKLIDLFKKEYAELQGYQVIYLWESDINNPEKFNIIKNAFQRYGEIENSENRENANT